MPHTLDEVYFSWLQWSQAETSFSAEEKNYILSLDPEEDRRILIEELNLSEKSAYFLFVSTLFLKIGELKGLNVQEIGSMVARKRSRPLAESAIPSLLEQTVERLEDKKCLSWTLFSQSVYEEVERTIDQYCHEKTVSQ